MESFSSLSTLHGICIGFINPSTEPHPEATAGRIGHAWKFLSNLNARVFKLGVFG
jgi:hypothetical protein